MARTTVLQSCFLKPKEFTTLIFFPSVLVHIPICYISYVTAQPEAFMHVRNPLLYLMRWSNIQGWVQVKFKWENLCCNVGDTKKYLYSFLVLFKKQSELQWVIALSTKSMDEFILLCEINIMPHMLLTELNLCLRRLRWLCICLCKLTSYNGWLHNIMCVLWCRIGHKVSLIIPAIRLIPHRHCIVIQSHWIRQREDERHGTQTLH